MRSVALLNFAPKRLRESRLLSSSGSMRDTVAALKYVFEDSLTGIRSAHRAGVHVIVRPPLFPGSLKNFLPQRASLMVNHFHH
jgi:beta-phosphoglucomutase-like phosphatase (HAD superfamily)